MPLNCSWIYSKHSLRIDYNYKNVVYFEIVLLNGKQNMIIARTEYRSSITSTRQNLLHIRKRFVRRLQRHRIVRFIGDGSNRSHETTERRGFTDTHNTTRFREPKPFKHDSWSLSRVQAIHNGPTSCRLLRHFASAAGFCSSDNKDSRHFQWSLIRKLDKLGGKLSLGLPQSTEACDRGTGRGIPH